MKKSIALFSVLALTLLVAGPALAGNGGLITDWDDSVLTQVSSVRRALTFRNNAFADIENDLTIVSSTGGNFIAAGDDVDAGEINTNSANISASEQSDVNGFDVTYEGIITGSGSNDITGTDVDDSIVTQAEDLEEFENVESDTFVVEDTETDIAVLSGDNGFAAGGDAGEDSPLLINTGPTNVVFDRILVRNLTRVNRIAP